MENANKKVIDKISKLVAMGKCAGASEQERETAMRQAYALLAKHNLSMESLDEDQNPRERQDEEGHGMVWARQIAGAIAELFFCMYAYSPSQKVNRCHHVFIGKRSNVAVAKELSRYVINSVFAEGNRRMKAEGGEKPYAWRLDFAKGAAYSLHKRCKKMRAEKEQEFNGSSETGTSLVLANHYEVEAKKNMDWLSSKFAIRAHKSKAKTASSASAFYSGAAYGESVNLSGGAIDKK